MLWINFIQSLSTLQLQINNLEMVTLKPDHDVHIKSNKKH